MKITVVFDSLEEFQDYFMAAQPRPDATKGFVVMAPNGDVRFTRERPAEPAQEPEKEPKKPVDTGTGAIRGATPEEMKQYEAEEKAAKPAPKAPRVEDVRKALAALNKKAGKNIAKELIASVGYKKLTEVPEGALVTLQSLIEEEEKNYA